jgi:hypothetical protein
MGVMSDEQFKTFLLAYSAPGNHGADRRRLYSAAVRRRQLRVRLEVIRDLPRGRVIWYLTGPIMAKAKADLGDVAASWATSRLVIHAGTPDEVTLLPEID